ncbi:hypothetical protein [Limnobacter sp. P1]|uniref:hypothetical protein n=1 Tax=Limnobacter olei TaxID=3031298 RepID=UPI0023B0C4C3|nr:hypothetical protein [Limnobacter sp. P1]
MTQTVYQKLLDRLDNAPVPLCRIAEEANVAQSTVSRISQRDCKNPRVKTVDALLAWFDAYDRTSTSTIVSAVGDSRDVATPLEVAHESKQANHNETGKHNVSNRRRRDWNAVRSGALGKKTSSTQKQ